MSDPGLALQDAIVATLRATPAVTALIGGRFFDRAPDDTAFPHAEIGEVQVLDDGADCLEDAAEIFVTLHVWSRAVGAVEARQITGAIRAALHLATLDLGADWALVEIGHRDTRTFDDGDGKTTHGVMTFRALIDPVN